MLETIGTLTVIYLIIFLVIKFSNREAEKSKSYSEDFEFYKKHSRAFYKKAGNLYWPRNKDEIIQILKESYIDKEIKNEIQKSTEFERNQEILAKSKNLMVFNNLEYLDALFKEDFEMISKTEFQNKLKGVFVSDEQYYNWVKKMVDLGILQEGSKSYTLCIGIITHPYKTDKYGAELRITFGEYKKYTNKSEWT